MEELKFPPISEERKKDIIMGISSAYTKHQGELNFDLPEEMLRNDALDAFRKERERRIEYALHYLIPHPIKGEITKGKCRWRGLYLKEEDWHLSTSDIAENENGGITLTCRFAFPRICGLPSRSGKRAAFEISLGFDLETFVPYQAWCQKNDTIMFGVCGRSYGKRATMYRCSGLAEQIQKGDHDGEAC